MPPSNSLVGRRQRAAVLAVLLALASPAASAVDLSAFVGWGNPGENWKTGYGFAAGFGFLRLLQFEGEYAHNPGEAVDGSNVNTYSGSVLVTWPAGPVRPYAGLTGGYYSSDVTPLVHDSGFLSAFVIGAKVKLSDLFFVKGEYRHYHQSAEPTIPLDSRISVGVGLSL